MNKYFGVCVATVFLFAGGTVFTACKRGVETAAKAAAYHCPMHPTYVSDRPGDCPPLGPPWARTTGDKAGQFLLMNMVVVTEG